MARGASIGRSTSLSNDSPPHEMPRGASVGRSTSLSNDPPPHGILEMLLDDGFSPDNMEEEPTTNNIEDDDTASNSVNESNKDEPIKDDRGRRFVHLRGKYLYPSGVVASICTYNFKKLVDPNGFSQRTLSNEYIDLYWAEFKKFANVEAYDQEKCKTAFVSKCKARYGDFISYYKKKTKKPSFYTDAQWLAYTNGWKKPESIEASERCSTNRKQGQETAPGTHSNGCVSFAETAEKLAKENNGKLLPFMDFFHRTHKLRNNDSQGLCSQRAQQIVDDVMVRAEEQRAQGIENPDHEAIFMELYGKVKKRKQISGAGQATGIYFPLAANSSVGSAPVNASQIDEMVEQRVQESREQMQLQIEKVQADSDRKIAMVREEAAKREQQMQADSDRKIAMVQEEAAKREQKMEERLMRLFNEKIGQMTNV